MRVCSRISAIHCRMGIETTNMIRDSLADQPRKKGPPRDSVPQMPFLFQIPTVEREEAVGVERKRTETHSRYIAAHSEGIERRVEEDRGYIFGKDAPEFLERTGTLLFVTRLADHFKERVAFLVGVLREVIRIEPKTSFAPFELLDSGAVPVRVTVEVIEQ